MLDHVYKSWFNLKKTLNPQNPIKLKKLTGLGWAGKKPVFWNPDFCLGSLKV